MFALSSDDNSEFWLSTDDSPLHVQLLAFVGEVGPSGLLFQMHPGHFFYFFIIFSSPVRNGQLLGNSTNTPVKPLDQFGEWNSFFVESSVV